MDASATRPVNLPTLTGLRYAAALLVVMCHAAPLFVAGTLLGNIGKGGFVGVSFFFVLSGFVLTWSLDERAKIRDFYRRRVARIYPLHVLTLTFALIAGLAAPGLMLGGLGPDLLNLLLLHAWFPADLIHFSENLPSWSLSCEAFFYAVFPFLTLRLGLHRRGSWLIAAVVVVAVGGAFYSLSPAYVEGVAYVSPAYRLMEFIIGILLADAIRQRRLPRIPLGSATAAVLLTMAILGVTSKSLVHGLVAAVMLPSVVLLIAAGAQADLASRRSIWASGTVVRLGQWSFALYLTHWLLLKIIERLHGGSFHLSQPAGAASLVGFFVVTTCVSGVLYRCFEVPWERRLRGNTRAEAQLEGATAADSLERDAR